MLYVPSSGVAVCAQVGVSPGQGGSSWGVDGVEKREVGFGGREAGGANVSRAASCRPHASFRGKEVSEAQRPHLECGVIHSHPAGCAEE